jgi:hypothetical protein
MLLIFVDASLEAGDNFAAAIFFAGGRARVESIGTLAVCVPVNGCRCMKLRLAARSAGRS